MYKTPEWSSFLKENVQGDNAAVPGPQLGAATYAV